MSKKRTKRASKPQTIRLDADAERIVESMTLTTGWSVSNAVNRLLVAGYLASQGSVTEAKLLTERAKAAARYYEEQKKSEKRLAELRAKERAIANKIKAPHLAEIVPPVTT